MARYIGLRLPPIVTLPSVSCLTLRSTCGAIKSRLNKDRAASAIDFKPYLDRKLLLLLMYRDDKDTTRSSATGHSGS